MFLSTDTPEQRVDAIWQSLVRYVNSELPVKDFKTLAVLSFAIIGMDDPKGAFDSSEDWRDGATMEQLAEKYRYSLREVLHWILPGALLKERTIDGGSMMTALGFLAQHANTGLYYQVDNHSLNPTPTAQVLRRPTGVHSVVTGICHFILTQLDLHKGRGEPLAELFPLMVCERPDCGRFFVVQRSGRARFCSDGCRSAANKGKLALPEKAAYMREYRASKKKVPKKKQKKDKKV
jgi:hypothetical protein